MPKTTAKFYRMEELSRSDTQLCFRLSLAIDPVSTNNWYIRQSIPLIKTGPLAGLYDFTTDYLLELQDGKWTCSQAAQ